MKKITVICCVLFSMLISAKGQDYHITDFLPDSLRSWQIRACLSTGGRTDVFGENKSFTEDTLKNEYESSQNDNYVSFRPDIYLGYKQITLKREIYWNTRLSLETIKSKEKIDNSEKIREQNIIKPNDSDTKTKKHSISPRINSSFSITQYLYKKFGLKLSGYMLLLHKISSEKKNVYKSYSYFERINHDKSSYKSKSNNTQIEFSFSPGIVLGRTYDGFYAAKAEEILIELKKINQLKRDLSRDEFKHLSMIILQHTEKFYFDSRIRRIEVLKDIINYLKDINAIENSDIMSILTINDIYLFSQKCPSRKFGTKIYISYNYRFNNNKMNQSSDIDSKYWINTYDSLGVFLSDFISNEYSIRSKQNYFSDMNPRGINIGVSFSKIKSWHFWYNIDFSCYYSLLASSDKGKYRSDRYNSLKDTTTVRVHSSNNKSNFKENSLLLSIGLNYQIDSRSIFTTNLNLYYNNSRTSEPSYYKLSSEHNNVISSIYIRKYEQSTDEISLNISPKFTYYITPKFSVSTDLNMNLYKEKYHKTEEKTYDDIEVKYFKDNIPNKWKFNTKVNLRFVYYF